MKKLLYVFLALTMAFTMVACPSPSNGGGDPPTVDGVEITFGAGVLEVGSDVYVEANKTAQFGATVTGDNNPPQTVTWEVTGAAETGTTISSTGLLTVDEDEAVDTVLTITATSTLDTDFDDTITVKVAPEDAKIITAVNVTSAGNVNQIAVGGSLVFTAVAVGNSTIGSGDQTFNWTVTGGSGTTAIAAGTPSNTATLTVDASEVAGASLVVTATSTATVYLGGGTEGTKAVLAAGAAVDPSEETPPIGAVNEIIALENGTYAIYKFTLPPGRTLGDYVAISAEYQILYPTVDATGKGAQIRSARLMGNFDAADFVEAWDEKPLNAYAVRLESGFNAPYIVQDLAGWTDDYTVVGLDPAHPTDWFTREIPLVVTYTANTKWPAATWPGPSDSRDLLVGIGLSGAGDHIVQGIKNVKLLATSDLNEIGVGSLYSLGSGFDKPAYVSSLPFPEWAAPYRGTVQPTIVKFNANGHGSAQRAIAVAPSTTFAQATAAGLILTPSVGGWLFQGWSTDEEGDNAVTGATVLTGTNMTLYAQWEVDPDYVAEPAADHPFPSATTDTDVILDIENLTWDNGANQKGWREEADIGKFTWAKYLVINLSQLPNGLEIVWQAKDGATYEGWNGTPTIFGWSATEAAILAADVTGITVVKESDDSYTVTVELSEVVKDYDKFIEIDTGVQFLFQTNNWAASVNSAKLIVPPLAP